MAYSTILDEYRRKGASFDEAVERLLEWAAGTDAHVDRRTAEEIEEERIAKQNTAMLGSLGLGSMES